jgi:hypothetical protein
MMAGVTPQGNAVAMQVKKRSIFPVIGVRMT